MQNKKTLSTYVWVERFIFIWTLNSMKFIVYEMYTFISANDILANISDVIQFCMCAILSNELIDAWYCSAVYFMSNE